MGCGAGQTGVVLKNSEPEWENTTAQGSPAPAQVTCWKEKTTPVHHRDLKQAESSIEISSHDKSFPGLEEGVPACSSGIGAR